MRYLCLYKCAKPEGTPPSLEEMARMGNFMEQEIKSGVLLSTEGLLPTSRGARVRLKNGEFTITDGPFAETKEVIGGMAIIHANSKQEAIESVKRFLNVAGDGETEVRELFDAALTPDAFLNDCFTEAQAAKHSA
jgi:hypothetical protein